MSLDIFVEKDGWVTCDFTSCLTVLQSYLDDGSVIMEGCVQWKPVYCLTDFCNQ